MSEAILLNQYSQNNGGGAVIRGIPPFNWYGKGVVGRDITLQNSTLSNKVPTGTETLETIVDVSGKGGLYILDLQVSNEYAFIIKVTIDDNVVLFRGDKNSLSWGSTISFIKNYSYTPVTDWKLEFLQNYTLMPFPDFSTNSLTIASESPLLFTKNLKIEGAVYSSTTKFNYIYDLFDK